MYKNEYFQTNDDEAQIDYLNKWNAMTPYQKIKASRFEITMFISIIVILSKLIAFIGGIL